MLSKVDDWQRAKASDLAVKLRRATNYVPVRQQVREICESVLGTTMLTEPLANLVRELLRELSITLNGCLEIERPLRDFELNLRLGCRKIIKGEKIEKSSTC